MNSDLKRCPFCGGNTWIHAHALPPQIADESKPYINISCRVCPAEMYGYEGNVESLWNKRVDNRD